MNTRSWTIRTLTAGIPAVALGYLLVFSGLNVSDEVEPFGAKADIAVGPQQLQLYPHDLPPGTEYGARERRVRLPASGVKAGFRLFNYNADHSWSETSLADDGETAISKDDYRYFYDRASNITVSLQTAEWSFEPDGKTIRSGKEFRADRTLAVEYATLSDGHRVTLSYDLDGVTVIARVTSESNWSSKISEEHFNGAKLGNRRLYSFVINGDRSRSETWYDGNDFVVKTVRTGKHDVIPGTVIEAFYPGTRLRRMRSETFALSTEASYYRRDGTLENTQSMTVSLIDVTHYDATGKTVAYKQHLKQTTGLGPSMWVVWKAEDWAADGSNRDMEFTLDANNTLETDDRRNFDINGRHYVHGIFTYRTTGFVGEIGTLSESQLRESGAYMFSAHNYPASANLRPDVPRYLKQLPVSIDENLPLPTGYYWGFAP